MEFPPTTMLKFSHRNFRFVFAHDNCASIDIDVRDWLMCDYDSFVFGINITREIDSGGMTCHMPAGISSTDSMFIASILFFYCSAGYTITCSLINTYVNRMGPYAMVERSDDFAFTSIRLQLRHMAHWNDNSVAVSHLHHIFGFGRKYRPLAQN